MQSLEKPVVEMRGIDKYYGGVHAVKMSISTFISERFTRWSATTLQANPP